MLAQEVSNTDLLMDLCDGIYLARVQGNLKAEWELYHAPCQHVGAHVNPVSLCKCTVSFTFHAEELIRIYRSPELLAHVADQKGSREHYVPGAFILVHAGAAVAMHFVARCSKPLLLLTKHAVSNEAGACSKPIRHAAVAGRRTQIMPSVPSLQSVPSVDSMPMTSRWQLVARQIRRHCLGSFVGQISP